MTRDEIFNKVDESEETRDCFTELIASVLGVACVGARYLLVALGGNVWGYMVK